MSNETLQNGKNQQLEKLVEKPKVGIGAWISLIVLVLILSGAFRTNPGPLKVLDFTNLSGKFGLIGTSGADLIGKGGTGAKDGFMAGLNLIPAVMLFCGLLGVFEQFGAFKASDILFRPLLRAMLGIPGKAGVAFISSFTGSDVAAIMTRDLVDNGDMTDDERTIFVAYQYAGSACINNTITGGAPILAFSPIALGPIIIIQFVCKVIGANIVRLIIKMNRKKNNNVKVGN
jgi:nucleoside recognition membrane protein YjiH